jgi:hypothetical protein
MCGDFCAMERGFSLFKDDIAGDKCRHGKQPVPVEEKV